MSRPAWLLERRLGIGASDIAAICKLSPFADACPLRVWMDKLGMLEDTDSVPMRSGRVMEKLVCIRYHEETGRRIRRMRHVIYSHPEYPWCKCSPDGVVLPEPSDTWAEIKTGRTSQGWGVPGTDEIPDGYQCQTQWQLFIGQHYGIAQIDVPFLVGGQEFRLYHVLPHPEVQWRLWEIARDFWQLVEERIPPAPDWTHPATPELVKLLCKPKSETTIALDSETAYSVDAWTQIGLEMGRLEKERKLHRARIDHAMGEHVRGILPDGTEVKRVSITHEASLRKGYDEVRMYLKRPRSGAESENV